MKKNLYFIIAVIFLSLFNYLPKLLFSQTYPFGFSQQKVASVNNPTSMAFAPDGRIFVTEKAGKVRVVKNDTLLSTPFVSLNASKTGGERGLHNMIFDPDFNNNHYVYVYYTVDDNPAFNRLERYTADGDIALSGSEMTILELEPLTNDMHNGGGMVFGPDGKLYLGVGDDYLFEAAQDISNNIGKILRINPDGTTPAGNPFSGSAAKERIWAYGLRNPYTMSIQPGSGKIFFNDVGGSKFEEINNATMAGPNFGWPVKEGASTDFAYTSPVYAYPHGTGNNSGCAISGGDFFNPNTSNYPAEYFGKYFFIDYCNGWINYIEPDNATHVHNFATALPLSCVYVKTGIDGNLYYISRGDGGVYRITYTQNEFPVIIQKPQSQVVDGGEKVAFEVSVSGAAPLSYQWDKNGIIIPGADSSVYIIENATLSDVGEYKVIATNAHGSVTSDIATLTVKNNNTAPVPTILLPLSATSYSGGDTIFFQGDATDAEDGPLPASAFSWEVNFHHGMHYHPGPAVPQEIKTDFFMTDTLGETAANVWYRLILTVTDAIGVSKNTYVDILPQTSTISFSSAPSGLQIKLEGQPEATPFSILGVEGMVRFISAPSPQVLGGKTYLFDHWGHGGNQSQALRMPENDIAFTAFYVEYEELIPLNSSWKYLDNGSNQDTAWRAIGWNDSTWASGDAELGYGDADEATIVGYGTDENNKYITTYFRKAFTVSGASSFTGLELKLLRDDGAVVYLNGNK